MEETWGFNQQNQNPARIKTINWVNRTNILDGWLSPLKHGNIKHGNINLGWVNITHGNLEKMPANWDVCLRIEDWPRWKLRGEHFCTKLSSLSFYGLPTAGYFSQLPWLPCVFAISHCGILSHPTGETKQYQCKNSWFVLEASSFSMFYLPVKSWVTKLSRAKQTTSWVSSTFGCRQLRSGRSVRPVSQGSLGIAGTVLLQRPQLDGVLQ